MQHPEEGTIHAWLDGALPADEAAQLESHVASCAECSSAVADARGIIAAASRIVGHLDVVPGNVIPAKRAKKTPWLRFAMPAAIAATLLITINQLRSKEETSLPVFAPTSTSTIGPAPEVATSPPRDSSPTTVSPLLRAENQAGRVAQAPPPATVSARDMAAAESQALPPASAMVQKSSAAAPTPAPPSVSTIAPSRVDVQAAEARAEVTTQTRARSRAANAAVGSAAGGAAGVATAPSMMDRAAALSEETGSAGFAGCYQLVGVSTTIIDWRFERFALMDEPAPTPGMLAVRELSAAGRAENLIPGAGWVMEDGKALLKDPEGKTVMTFTKTGPAIRGVTASGDRTARVVSCRK